MLLVVVLISLYGLKIVGIGFQTHSWIFNWPAGARCINISVNFLWSLGLYQRRITQQGHHLTQSTQVKPCASIDLDKFTEFTSYHHAVMQNDIYPWDFVDHFKRCKFNGDLCESTLYWLRHFIFCIFSWRFKYIDKRMQRPNINTPWITGIHRGWHRPTMWRPTHELISSNVLWRISKL